ncbi:uncharacterized protein PV07_11028 [Cladophialophora immunda]|uniref:Heterokaryon incompatibility domain-containing protein n=1 Tax=Cladophialophora immunda TaxID=569365 RepID=A0A0D2AD19_9EURO|nr:uncharacterized protein PV07_11028 [Cladophialophora immunda]KIW22762.1 hypothetical protein PV07_11028 [Cladophialophora immunda]OQU94016.1 hypothetical protein CLAIMM_00439 [Cladophialophora immunda]
MTTPARSLGVNEIRLVGIRETDGVAAYSLATSVYPIAENRPYTALSYVCGNTEPEGSDKPEASDRHDEPHQFEGPKIFIDGVEKPIYENLYNALPSLFTFSQKDRGGGKEEAHFWMDQISIDQNDEQQKANQMLHMTDIYSRAERVLIWLGPVSENLKALLQTFAEVIGPGARRAGILSIGPELATSWPAFRNNPDLRPVRRQVVRFFSSEPFRRAFATRLDMLLAFEALTWNKWFARTWTIQEHTVSTSTVFALGVDTFVDGDDFMASILCCTLWSINTARPLMQSRFLPLRLFRFALLWYYEKPGLFDYLIDTVRLKDPDRPRGWNSRASTMLGERRKRLRAQDGDHTQTSLKACLVRTFIPESTEASECTREIDRIWALFGMCTDRSILETGGFPLNYKVPWREAYREVSRTLIRLGHTDILGIERKGEAGSAQTNMSRNETQLPSWTADWSVPLRRPLCGLLEDGLFKAATHLQVSLGEQRPRVSSGEDNTLTIQGYCLGPIRAVGTVFTTSKPDSELDYAQAEIYLREIAAFVEQSTLIPARLKAHAKAYIPVHGLEYNYLAIARRAEPTSVQRGYDDMKKCAVRGAGPRFVISQELLSYKAFMERCLGKRPFITARGHVGLCAGPAEAGDVLAALAGAPGLVILSGSAAAAVAVAAAAAGGGQDHATTHSEDVGAFEVVGEAFAYGLMDGEMAAMEDLEETRFVLC